MRTILTHKTKETNQMATKTKPAAAATYDAGNIKTLEGLEGIRARPTMYIGAVGQEGVQHLFREVFDNGVDEYFDGHCTSITVLINSLLTKATVSDNGRGIPAIEKGVSPSLGLELETKQNALQRIILNLHSGGKFDRGSYSSSAGLNGVGTTAVAALSTLMTVRSSRDGFVWEQQFAKGKAKTKLKAVEAQGKKKGTWVSFSPDPSVLEVKDADGNVTDTATFSPDMIKDHCRTQSYLNAGLKVTVTLEGQDPEVHHHPEGIKEYVQDLNEKPLFKKVFHARKMDPKTSIDVEVAIGYSQGYEDGTMTFVNSIYTSEGGTHLQGFRMAMATIVKDQVKTLGILTKKEEGLEITGDDVREGLVAIVNVKHPDPKFMGQTKQKLGSSDAQGAVQKLMNEEFKVWLEGNKDEARVIAKKAVAAAKGRTAAKSARAAVQRSEGPSFTSMNSVSKLADCSSKKAEECELFVVEGDSAGGSAKGGRDSRTQAIYSLKGKPMNSCEKAIDKVLENKELADLVQVVGCGIGAGFDLSQLRYNKFIIMADADVDGHHIASLLLTFLYVHMKPLIENGHVYIAQSPLYRITGKGGVHTYFKDEEAFGSYVRKKAAKTFSVWKDNEGAWEELDDKGKLKLLSLGGKYTEELNRVSDWLAVAPEVTEALIDTDAAGAMEQLVMLGLKTKLIGDGWMQSEGDCKGRYHSFFFHADYYDAMADLIAIRKEIGCTAVALATEGQQVPGVYGVGAAIAKMMASAMPKHRQRIKGLGESNPQELWETTMDPATRSMLRVGVANYEASDSLVSRLMGGNPDTRKEYLEETKHLVKEVDV
jgi:DNA gyrase subunit B